MRIFSRLSTSLLAFSALGSPLGAQNQAPTVLAPPANLTGRPTTGPTKIFLGNIFRDPDLMDINGTQVRVTTTLGVMNLEMFDGRTPLTVQNFVRYIQANSYANSFWHRSVPGFIIQTGGFTFVNNATGTVPTFPPVQNEFGISNTRGTVAMAKLGGDPNSATSQWFVNLADNSANLDGQNGGFTVFGRVIEGGMTVADAIAALPIFNAGSPFDSLPLRNYTSGTIVAANLIFVDAITSGPKISFSSTSSNSAVATATTSGFTTTLAFAGGTGTTQVTLTATDFNGAFVSSTFDVTVSPTAPLAHLANIATRAQVGTADNVLIGGFVVRGTAPKKVLIRAIGPSLAGAVPGTLADPQLTLIKDGAVLATNDDWKTTQQAEIAATPFAPTNDKESAILRTLAPGAYTAVVNGAGASTGVALVEVYELDGAEVPQLINIAARGRVGTGDNVMIGGFVIGGTTPKKVLIRAIGPSNANTVPGALADPTMQIFANTVLIAENDDWRKALDGSANPDQAAIAATPFAPTNDKESAVIATLAPGLYTAIVRGTNASQGIASIEIYDLE